MFNLSALSAFILMSFAAFANEDCKIKATERIDDVQRIFMTQNNVFELIVPTSDKIFHIRTVNAWSDEYVTILTDVPDDKPMFVLQQTCAATSFVGDDYGQLELHVHSVKEVEGGGWRRQSGKVTLRGETQVIE